MEQQLRKYADRVLCYEEREKQDAALKVIPVDAIRESAKKRLKGVVHDDEGDIKNPQHVQFRCPDAAVAKELLYWFKKELFTWVNGFDCPVCGVAMVQNKHGEPNEDEIKHAAGNASMNTKKKSLQ